MASLTVKMLVIIMVLMLILSFMKQFNMIPRMVRLMRGWLKILGLSEQMGMLWLTAGVFGLSYGAAVIVEETREGDFDPAELENLHISIGINHSLVEDPALFLSLGLSPFWLWVPRLVAAVIIVHFHRLFIKKGRKSVFHRPS